MPDITICTNGKCPLSHQCWRFQAPSKTDGSQSYFEGVWNQERVCCPDYWPMDEKPVDEAGTPGGFEDCPI